MRKALIYVVFVIAAYGRSYAQNPYEYYYNNAAAEEQSKELTMDMGLFMFPPGGYANLFRSLSEYNFSSVKYNRRGYTARSTHLFWGGIDLSGLVAHSPDYSFLSILNRSDFMQSDYPAQDMSRFNFSLDAASYAYPDDLRSIIPQGARASVFAYNRRGRYGMRFSAAGDTHHDNTKTYAGITVSHRWGRDPNIGGIFTQEPSVLAGFDRKITDDHHISFVIGATGVENGLRSYATAEAFELTGDNYYNPSWGYYGGRERSAKVIQKLNLFPLLNYHGRLGASTTLTASAYYRVGVEKRSGLSWFDAQTPYPDYYRYMPGYEPSNLETGWMDNDPQVTQIFWEQLVRQNLNSQTMAAYIVSDRVERISHAQFSVSASTLVDEKFTLVYGMRYGSDKHAYYKELNDLLGAAPIPDVDQYLLDDDIFGEYHLNDKRNPERLVNEGDRFGYDYRLEADKIDFHAALNYAGTRFRGGAGIEVGRGSLQREGLYEKELFPGRGSYGRSDSYKFDTYSLKVAGGYSFSARHSAWVSLSAAEAMPYSGTLFLNPDYSNYAIAKPQTISTLSADAGYSAILDRFMLNASAFATRTANESAVYRYWDDIESVYANMALTGIDKLYYGIELAAQYELSQRFTVNFTALAGSYSYDSDPEVEIIADATRHTVISGSKSRLKNHNLATSPQKAISGAVQYSSWGWIASMTASYMGGRYVEISPLRRMERAYGLAGSPEEHNEFVGQERLADAFTMNFFLLRSFSVRNGTLTVVTSINNLLNDTNIVYHGYEQMRIVKSGSAPNYNWKPFPSKYLYGYGRTYYVSLNYSF